MPADDEVQLTDRTIQVGNWKFSRLEVILGGAVVCGIFFFLLFAGLYGQKSSDFSAVSSQLTDATKPVCTDRWCLETMGHVASFFNTSYDPCDNFFQFACGGYKVERELDPEKDVYHNVFEDMYNENQARLQNILGRTTPNGLSVQSSERKLRDFYQSCVGDFEKEQLKGKPLIDQILSPLGGWYVLQGRWDQSAWDLNMAKRRTGVCSKYPDLLHELLLKTLRQRLEEERTCEVYHVALLDAKV
ncbi:hypothetical protein BaRGS_00018605 [Batillaria attramentaria]|uniref:Peptidase M13 N-terminal domain-containing protein n=1 Tax=Batillaria attramentaria TaxID=370345 RepID=A0ABD0KT60_9CAEN